MPNNRNANKILTPNNPCIRCDRPESECNMIGCQECQKWLHNKCDPEVKDDEGAASIEIYYCPPCRDRGFELVKYIINPTGSVETKEHINKLSTDEEEKSNAKNNSGNEDTEIDFAEDVLNSPLLTPYQRPPDENKEELNESNHDLTLLINSIPDPVKEDPNYKIKEIVEKIKNVSISPKRKKEKKPPKKPRKMVHRSREEILKENNKLTKIIDKITAEKEKAEEKIKEMEKALITESEYRSKMENLEEKLKRKDETTIEKTIYEAENCKQAQDKKIKDLQTKIEDLRKKNIDKQNELTELKKHNEECSKEIDSLKTASEKETDLRTKAEELLRLTEEKAKAQESQLKEITENHTAQMTKLREQFERQQKSEKQEIENSGTEIEKLKKKDKGRQH